MIYCFKRSNASPRTRDASSDFFNTSVSRDSIRSIPVSYTHLDVYKRQPPGLPLASQRPGAARRAGNTHRERDRQTPCRQQGGRDIIPVSYTHLDVYKRQGKPHRETGQGRHGNARGRVARGHQGEHPRRTGIQVGFSSTSLMAPKPLRCV